MKMTRNEYINQMIQKAYQISGKNAKNWRRDAENEIWDMAMSWNDNHEGNEEINVYEYCNDDCTKVIGFMIEDDYFITDEEEIA
jgi:hypothetical protein